MARVEHWAAGVAVDVDVGNVRGDGHRRGNVQS